MIFIINSFSISADRTKKKFSNLFYKFSTNLIPIADKCKEQEGEGIREEEGKKKAKDIKYNIIYKYMWRKC